MSDKEKAIGVLERVTLAAHFLCIGKGDVRSRVEDVVTSQLFPLREQDFPADLQAKYRAIIQAATKYDASDLDRAIPLPYGRSHNEYEGRLRSTMRRIRRSTGAKIARDIWDLYVAVRQIAELH